MEGLPLEIVASASAGCAATVLGHPLDCIKVRLQAQQGTPKLSTLSMAGHLLQTDGPRAFFRGAPTAFYSPLSSLLSSLLSPLSSLLLLA